VRNSAKPELGDMDSHVRLCPSDQIDPAAIALDMEIGSDGKALMRLTAPAPPKGSAVPECLLDRNARVRNTRSRKKVEWNSYGFDRRKVRWSFPAPTTKNRFTGALRNNISANRSRGPETRGRRCQERNRINDEVSISQIDARDQVYGQGRVPRMKDSSAIISCKYYVLSIPQGRGP